MRKLLFTLLLSLMTLTSNAQILKLGDLNHDNQVDISDVVTLVNIVLNGYSPYSLSATEVTMQTGGTTNVNIEGGYSYYEVVSANPDIVTASLNGLTVTLKALAGGETTVTVRDVLTFRTIDISVVVNSGPLQVTTNELSLIAGEQGIVEINSGSGYYSVQSSDVNVATAVMNGNSVVVTAVGGGTATLTVTDTKTNQTVSISVSAYYPDFVLDSTNDISLDLTNLTATVEILSGSGFYNVTSDDEEVATAAIDGTTITVTAIGDGNCNITVIDTKSNQSAAILVTVSDLGHRLCPDDHHPHMIDLGLPSGTKWACCNVGTVIPEGYGSYFAWGETEVKQRYNWDTYSYCHGTPEKCWSIGTDIAGTQYDVAHIKWGGSWVMPSKEQQKELRDNCTYEWTTVNGVNGGKFTGKNGKSIFLPAAGHRFDSGTEYAGSSGHYWSSSCPQEQIYLHSTSYLYIGSGNPSGGSGSRCLGLPIRPVSK